MGPLGTTYVAAIGGFLTAFWRAPLAPSTLGFALIYGLLVDGSCTAFRVRAGDLKTGRLVASMAMSTAAMGLVTYYLSAYVFALLPENPIMYIGIIVAGVLNGVACGYQAALVWKRALRYIVEIRS
ncbi:MAG: hypothetical protein ACE5GD_07645 [Candidatus Geothermarchaeales archaeon]